jgi:trimeric autotransporter adhesin
MLILKLINRAATTGKALIIVITLMSGIIPINAQPLIISTVAGTGAYGNMGDGGAAIAARLAGPGFVAFDAAGNLFISDYANNNVRKVSTTGIITTVAGSDSSGYTGDGGAATLARLTSPAGIAVDNSGNLFIANQFSHVVRKVNTSGIISTVAGTGTAGFSGDGGDATSAQLNEPTDLAIDHAGNLYISDYYNSVIRKVNTAGIITTYAGIPDSSGFTGNDGPATAAKISGVFGIGIDNSDNLYIAESFPQKTIRKINTSGIISLVCGNDTSTFVGDGMPATATKLDGPTDIAFDASGNLYFSESHAAVIRMIAPDGTLTTYAGNGHDGFGGDGGSPIHATLRGPVGVAFDLANDLYIADVDNSRVRKVGIAALTVDNHLADNTVSIYPNPGNGIFHITGLSAPELNTLIVTDISGKQVYHANPKYGTTAIFEITLPQSLPTGLYFVNIATAGSYRHFPLLLEH